MNFLAHFDSQMMWYREAFWKPRAVNIVLEIKTETTFVKTQSILISLLSSKISKIVYLFLSSSYWECCKRKPLEWRSREARNISGLLLLLSRVDGAGPKDRLACNVPIVAVLAAQVQEGQLLIFTNFANQLFNESMIWK